MHINDFDPNFYWGVSSAAFQTEGAYKDGGKSLSIWDTFTEGFGKIKNGDNAKQACDFYHRYGDDLDLMQSLSIPNFRLSLSWSRIIKEGGNKINTKGLDYYRRVIDKCLENGITPWLTVYHWDLPQWIQDKGGWTNRDVLKYFEEYTSICGREFGKTVKNWMVLNEPMVFTGLGHYLGMHAPGLRGFSNFIPAIHHAALAQAEGYRILKSEVSDGYIGSTFSCSYIQPYRKEKSDDQDAAKKGDAIFNRIFIEPILGLGYPVDTLPVMKKIYKYYESGDDVKLKADLDFVGLQTYTREKVRFSMWMPYVKAQLVSPEKRNVPTTEMGWEVYPKAVYRMLKRFNKYKNLPPIIVTENGAAMKDFVIGGKVNDPKRIYYLKNAIKGMSKAMAEGVDCRGYFVWTFTDNFEWNEGYFPRFGLVYTDYKTQKRIVKGSGYWYKDFLEGKKKIDVD
ncbi:GH1 family beta-glucosidase [Aureibacter tunicatorum]|uniref:Beta-glucosidase n=1 Tax=Aureibacter tunicatorum TaxID=866807 RepID=A0AAE4BSR0_9BACT|nr:GH1 family beta-glucosidase [Aureibacter tunicatorum]MDR6239083.1 beta-glucosidase [Aureibacter tunicatorum]BDD04991.1 beta-glucosidase [Aureibacter tunicatorum]